MSIPTRSFPLFPTFLTHVIFQHPPTSVFAASERCFSTFFMHPNMFFVHPNNAATVFPAPCQTPQETGVGDTRNKNTKNKPKKCPNSANMMGCFLWICMSETCQQFQATLTPGGEWEIHIKHSWRNPPKNFYEVTTVWETNVKNSWRNRARNFNRSHKK